MILYNNSVYAYGCAYYNGCTGGSRFNDVAKIVLINSSAEILNGGNFFYRGKKNDVNVCGVYSSSALKVNSTSCEYMAENGNDDFPGNENVTISIVNMCIKLNESVDSNTHYLKMVEKKVNAIIYAEAKYEDYVSFTTLGMDVVWQDKKAILGWAFYKGRMPTNADNRLNDCDCITLKFDEKVAVQGGYLHYTGNYDDWNTQSTLAAYTNALSNELKYWADNCYDDFPGKDATQTTIYISGICILQ